MQSMVAATTKPPKVDDEQRYWLEAPPERSARCQYWLDRIAAGWYPNKHIRAEGYHSSATFYGVYIWEYIHEIQPAIDAKVPSAK